MLRSTDSEPERIRSAAAAAMLGISTRTVQALAASGRLPGAAIFGRVWTFDRIKLRQFIEMKETECANRIYIKGPKSGGCAPPSAVSNTEKAYEQAISRLLGKPETPGLNKSKRAFGGVREMVLARGRN